MLRWRSHGGRRSRSAMPGRWLSTGSGSRWRRPSRSGSSGLVSSTTRPCRGSPRSACCWRPVCAAATRRGSARAPSRAIEQIDTEIASMRALITDLRPDSLAELGVAAALEALAQRIRERVNGAEVAVEIGPRRRRSTFPTRRRWPLYRVAQEAMNNAVKHGGAASIKVASSVEGAEVVLRVSDDGAGFDPGSARQRLRDQGDARAGGAGRRSARSRLGAGRGRDRDAPRPGRLTEGQPQRGPGGPLTMSFSSA